MKQPFSRRIRYAAISAALGAVVFSVFGDPTRIPGGWFGFAALLCGVFALALFLYGKVF